MEIYKINCDSIEHKGTPGFLIISKGSEWNYFAEELGGHEMLLMFRQ